MPIFNHCGVGQWDWTIVPDMGGGDVNNTLRLAQPLQRLLHGLLEVGVVDLRVGALPEEHLLLGGGGLLEAHALQALPEGPGEEGLVVLLNGSLGVFGA